MSDIIILDGDSMVYLACYKEPSFARRKAKLLEDVKRVQNSLEADEIYPLFKGVGNFRFNVIDTYKGNRSNKELDDETIKLKERVKELTTWAGENLGMACDNAEADDWVGILNKKFLEEGHNVIMSHIDKDLNQLIGWHHNFNKNETYEINPITAYHWLCKQTLMGDAADNIAGLDRIGIKTAEKMLDSTSPENWWDLICKAYQDAYSGDWQDKLAICANLVYMRTDEDKLRALSFEEIKETYRWEPLTLDTGALAQTQDSLHRESSDLSTESLIELLDGSTSVKNKSTPTRSRKSQERSAGPRSSKKPSGETTQAPVRQSTKTSRSKAKTTLTS